MSFRGGKKQVRNAFGRAPGEVIRILILEDEVSDAELLLIQLEESGFAFDCRWARNKREFTTYLAEYPADIILSDYSLPGFTGLEALSQVRSKQPFTPFIVVTGTLGEEKAVETILNGATDFLLKEHLANLSVTMLRAWNLSFEQREKHNLTEQLEKNEMQFRGLIENSHDAMIIFDMHRIISYASPAIERLIGFLPAEVAGRKVSDFIHLEDHAYQKAEFRELLGGTRSKIRLQQRWVCRDGSEKWMDSLISDQRSVAGIRSFVSNIRDVTEYVQVRSNLVERNLLLDTVMNNLSEGLVVSDRRGKILIYNRSAMRILQMGSGEKLEDEWYCMTGLYKADMNNEYNSSELPFFRALSGVIIENEEMYIRNDRIRSGLHLNVNARPLKGDSSNYSGAVVSFSDITEKKRYQRELEDTLAMMEKKVEERTRDLQEAHQELHEAHLQTTYSINYARRIQQAITLSEEELKKQFPDSFLLYLPRDIVSGDFVWMHGHGGSHLAVADCTGHGVPGAMMSMVGSDLLERIAGDRRIYRPEIILEELDKEITRIMKGGSNQEPMNDGMDISLCSFDYESGTLTYSGAHNHGWFFHERQLTVLEADHKAIGGFRHGNTKEFRRSQVSFTKGDRLYLVTDGFQDQFGGPHMKKFTRKRLLEHLSDIQDSDMASQGRMLMEIFMNWKGDGMQIDDVTVLGVEFR